ncbi:MAG: hypothetical protein C0594_06785 [Marinilabiliales bacterium]|nr:MAG: hypothetical protein C0594_06785 [Marinilabiliales bacterium]
MTNKDFINKIIINEISSMIDAGFQYFAFILITQSIETLGAIIDNKPLKAKSQSKQRFASALYKLFPGRYSFLNKNNWLYDKLRNQVVHVLYPSSSIHIINNKEDKSHLQFENNILKIHIYDYYKDLVNAAEKTLVFLEKKDNLEKEIPFCFHIESLLNSANEQKSDH